MRQSCRVQKEFAPRGATPLLVAQSVFLKKSPSEIVPFETSNVFFICKNLNRKISRMNSSNRQRTRTHILPHHCFIITISIRRSAAITTPTVITAINTIITTTNPLSSSMFSFVDSRPTVKAHTCKYFSSSLFI